MALGPGRYDDACTAARIATGAEAVVLIVVHGDRGNGFSVQTSSMEIMDALPDLLRHVADEMEDD